jgi:predicted regulator of Ras-like GTPase activity (Roadblock/LC7/MglB family)
MKKKTSSKLNGAKSAEALITPSVEEENPAFADLQVSLSEISNLPGVTGYILRSSTKAVIDISEQDRIINYALLSSQIRQSSQEMAKQLNLEEMERVLIEGGKLKVLCISLIENKIDVFMEKTATHEGIIKRFLL